MTALSRAFTSLLGAAGDNPVVEKDALTQLRGLRTQLQIIAAFGITFLAASALLLGFDAMIDDGRRYGMYTPGGRPMLAILLGVALGAISLFVPVLASTSIAAERERGTLPLLTATALSPLRIVIGKLLAVLASTGPFFLPLLALFPLANAYGDVALPWVAGALAVCAWHMVAMASVGVWVSASAERLRTAAPQALLVGVGASVVGALPFVVLAGVRAAGERFTDVLPFAALGVLVETAVLWLAIVNAKNALSPVRASRWRTRRVPVLVLVVGAPLAAAALSFFVSASSSQDELLALLHLEAAAIVFVTVLLEVAVSDQSRADQRRPAVVALVLTALAGAAIALARLLPTPAGLDDGDETLFTFKWASVVVVVGYLGFAAMTTALFARVAARPAVRVVLTCFVLLGLFTAPLVLHEARHVLDLGMWNFLWVQPVAVIDAIEHGARWTSPLLGVVAFVLAPLALFWVARGRRPV